jgi:hypothetical protein
MAISKLFGRKKREKHPVTQREPDFPVLAGTHYIEFLGQYHQQCKPVQYLEVGTQRGRSLAKANCRCIAVDPEFKVDTEIVTAKPDLFLYQGTSDDFFASGYLERNAITLDFAFLDGMHLFEYLLRDFMNTEAHSAASGVISMHDCVPYARIMADRDWDKTTTRSWTGDVWKLLPILARFRPELTVDVLDCEPTGLVMVSGLDPSSTVLRDAYDEIIAEYTALRLEEYGVARFVSELALVQPQDFLRRGVTP